MASCIIFCAAEFSSLAENICPEDFVIAADGGLVHTQVLGIAPNAVIGDFDSLGFVPEGAAVYPVEKDDTDAMLCIRHGLSLGYRRFLLYGSLDGPRLDHTVANFQVLQYLADQGAQGYLIGKNHMVTVVKNSAVTFPGSPEGILSVFCLGPDATGVTLTGLQYPMEKGTLTAGFPLGVSNHFQGTSATVRVEDGSLLLIWSRENGFPTRER